MPAFIARQSQRLFGWSAGALVLLGALGLMAARRPDAEPDVFRRRTALLLGLVVAPLGWYLGMPYHVVRHPHTVSQLLPLVVAVMGGVIVLLAGWLFGRGASPGQRVLAAAGLAVLVGGQAQTTLAQRGGERNELAAVAEALGPDAFPPRVGVLSNIGVPPFTYHIRRPCWLVPDLHHRPPVPFPEAIERLQRHLPADWTIRYYLLASWADRTAFELLVGTCPGRVLTLPGTPVQGLLLFDISALRQPPERRPPLDPQVRTAQLRGEFAAWELPGFAERLARARAARGPPRGAAAR